MRLSKFLFFRPSATFFVVLAIGTTVAVQGAGATMSAEEFEDVERLPVDFESGDVRALLQDVCHIDMTSIPVTERNVITALRESQPDLLREQTECMVCFECLHADSLSTLSCSHAMHRKCFKQLRRPRACPKCRHEGPHDDTGRETTFKKALRVFESNGWVPEMPQEEMPSAEEEQQWDEAEDSPPEAPALGELMETPFTTFVESEYTGLFMVALGTLDRITELIDMVTIWERSAHTRLQLTLSLLKESAEAMRFGEDQVEIGEPPSAQVLASRRGKTEAITYLREYIGAILPSAMNANQNAVQSAEQNLETDPHPGYVRDKLWASIDLMTAANSLLYTEHYNEGRPQIREGISPLFAERMGSMFQNFVRAASTLVSLSGNHGWDDSPDQFVRFMDQRDEFRASLQRVMSAWQENMED